MHAAQHASNCTSAISCRRSPVFVEPPSAAEGGAQQQQQQQRTSLLQRLSRRFSFGAGLSRASLGLSDALGRLSLATGAAAAQQPAGAPVEHHTAVPARPSLLPAQEEAAFQRRGGAAAPTNYSLCAPLKTGVTA